MPFTKHVIEPNNISQCPLPAGEPNELECLSNLTLANVIRQLSSLGLHAGRIFNELTQEAVKINHRSQLLNQRIDNLKQKCSQLDIQTEEVSLADFQTKKQFKSSIKIDQQVVSRKTMPEAMRIMYENAEPPPSLDKLNVFRTDGKDAMKFYTDPEFFFNIWYNELMKDNETRKNEKKRRKTKGEKSQSKLSGAKTPKELGNGGQAPPFMMVNGQMDPAMLGDLGRQHFFPGAPNGQPPPRDDMAFQTHIYQSKIHYPDFDHSLPSPPSSMVLNVESTEIHANMSKLPQVINYNSGSAGGPSGPMNMNAYGKPTRMPNMPINGQHMMHSERPMMPPPPVPNNKISDLQQLQQQFVLRKLTDISLSGGGHAEVDSTGDLPPPPPPPDNDHDYGSQGKGGANNHPKGNQINNDYNFNNPNSLVTVTMATYSQKTAYSSNEMLDSDMPLPPPPLELQEANDPASNGGHNVSHANSNGNFPPPPLALQNSAQSSNLPPPPPLPPLVESDTASSSTSSLSTVNNSQTAAKQTPSTSEANKNPRRFLDDINERRYQLKSTNKDTNSTNTNDDRNSKDPEANTIQPFVNNSDVAAIIDFIRKYRPHVRDSSDEEENSDWDD